jgi:hypothetical protein
MNKFFISFIFIVIFSLLNVEAAVYKGQKEFVKKCAPCHSEGQEFVAQKTISEWKEIMRNSGKELIRIHLTSKDEKAKDSYIYFKSKAFKKKSVHLIQFLTEYAKDSGKVPACN